MKNNIKATKMQLAEKRSVKAPVSCLQTKKVSNEIAFLSKQLKGFLRDRTGANRASARAAKKNSYYIGMDLGDSKSNYCFLDATGDIVAEGTLATNQTELSELFSSIPKCRVAIGVGTHSPWISALLENHGHEVIVD